MSKKNKKGKKSKAATPNIKEETPIKREESVHSRGIKRAREPSAAIKVEEDFVAGDERPRKNARKGKLAAGASSGAGG